MWSVSVRSRFPWGNDRQKSKSKGKRGLGDAGAGFAEARLPMLVRMIAGADGANLLPDSPGPTALLRSL